MRNLSLFCDSNIFKIPEMQSLIKMHMYCSNFSMHKIVLQNHGHGRFMFSLALLFVFVVFFVCLCVFVLVFLALWSPRLGKREVVYVLLCTCLFILHALIFVLFLFLLVTGIRCGLWFWHFLDFSIMNFFSLLINCDFTELVTAESMHYCLK